VRTAICAFFAALLRTAKHLREPLIGLYESVLTDYRYSREYSPFLVCTVLSVMWHLADHTVPLLSCSSRAFVNAVLPLLGDEDFTVFSPMLERIFTIFFEDSRAIGVPTLSTIVSIFPLGNSRKQLSLLGLLAIVLEQPLRAREDLVLSVTRLLVQASGSQNEFVAQAALKLLGQRGVGCLLDDCQTAVFPLVIREIARVITDHWSPFVRQSARVVLASFQKRSGQFVRECMLETSASMPVGRQPTTMELWRMIAKWASESYPDINITQQVQSITDTFRKDGSRGTMGINYGRASTVRDQLIVVPTFELRV
jgi:hypothetical protein